MNDAPFYTYVSPLINTTLKFFMNGMYTMNISDEDGKHIKTDTSKWKVEEGVLYYNHDGLEEWCRWDEGEDVDKNSVTEVAEAVATIVKEIDEILLGEEE